MPDDTIGPAESKRANTERLTPVEVEVEERQAIGRQLSLVLSGLNEHDVRRSSD